MLNTLKEIFIRLHTENSDEIKTVNNYIRNQHALLGDGYLDTIDFVGNVLKLRRLEIMHRITFDILRLWR